MMTYKSYTEAVMLVALAISMVPPAACSAPLDINVIMSSYLGGVGRYMASITFVVLLFNVKIRASGRWTARIREAEDEEGTEDTAAEALTVAMDSNGRVFVGGRGAYNFGLDPISLDSAGDGFVLVLSDGGEHLEKIYRHGTEVTRVVVREKDGTRRVLLQSDSGLVLFDDDMDHTIWSKPMACPRDQCFSDLGTDGTVAVVVAPEEHEESSNFTIQSFALNGSTIGSASDREKVGGILTDVAVDPINQLIIMSSYNQEQHLKSPCVIALDYTTEVQKWHNYCVAMEELIRNQDTAICSIERIHYSDFDNRLYMTANTHGLNNVLRYNPLDIRNNYNSLQGLQPFHRIDGWDMYTQPGDMNEAFEISFLAKYNPADGAMEEGRYFMTRTPSTDPPSGNNLRNVDISTGPDGTLVMAQDARDFIENRDNLTINNQSLASYAGPHEAVLMAIPPQMDCRLVWHHFAKTAGNSNAVAVATSHFRNETRVAFIAYSSDNEFFTTQELPGTGKADSAINQYVIVILEVPEDANPKC